jgi:hypothetical protein
MSLKNVLSVMGLVNQPGTLKLWAHENGPKTQKKNEFLVMSLKHVLKCHGPCTLPQNPKTVGT